MKAWLQTPFGKGVVVGSAALLAWLFGDKVAYAFLQVAGSFVPAM